MPMYWMMGADADQLPISPKNTDWRNSPQHEYPITPYLEELSLIFSSSITPHVLHIQLYEPSNNSYIYQILYRFYTII